VFDPRVSAAHAFDGVCQDGGVPDAYTLSNICIFGTDCEDCGPRNAPPAPPKDSDPVPPLSPKPPFSPPPSLGSELTEGEACDSEFVGDANVERCESWCEFTFDETISGATPLMNCQRCSCKRCGICAFNGYAAPTPPMPPTSPNEYYDQETVLDLDFTLAGTAESWSSDANGDEMVAAVNSVAQEVLTATVNDNTILENYEVNVSVTSGSANVHVEINMHASPDSSSLERAEALLAHTFSDASKATLALHLPVVLTPRVDHHIKHIVKPSQPVDAVSYTVVITMQASGDVTDYDDAKKDAILLVLTTTLGLSSAGATLEVTAGSVILRAVFPVSSAQEAETVQTLVATTMGSIAATQALFDSAGVSITVESIPQAEVESSADDETGLAQAVLIGIIVGAVGGCICCACVLFAILVLWDKNRLHSRAHAQAKAGGSPPRVVTSATASASSSDSVSV